MCDTVNISTKVPKLSVVKRQHYFSKKQSSETGDQNLENIIETASRLTMKVMRGSEH